MNSTTKRSGRSSKHPMPVPPEAGPWGCIPHLDARTRKAVERATQLLEKSAVYRVEAINNPGSVRAYLRLRLSGLEREEFHALWLDTQHRIIAFETISAGSLAQTSVYPREVVKSALAHNAAAVVFAHNHPSGAPEPSAGDRDLNQRLKTALELVDVRVLDHFIVAGTAPPLSFAERGLL